MVPRLLRDFSDIFMVDKFDTPSQWLEAVPVCNFKHVCAVTQFRCLVFFWVFFDNYMLLNPLPSSNMLFLSPRNSYDETRSVLFYFYYVYVNRF